MQPLTRTIATLTALTLTACADPIESDLPKKTWPLTTYTCVSVTMGEPEQIRESCDAHEGCYFKEHEAIFAPVPRDTNDHRSWEILGHELGHHLYGEFHERD